MDMLNFFLTSVVFKAGLEGTIMAVVFAGFVGASCSIGFVEHVGVVYLFLPGLLSHFVLTVALVLFLMVVGYAIVMVLPLETLFVLALAWIPCFGWR